MAIEVEENEAKAKIEALANDEALIRLDLSCLER